MNKERMLEILEKAKHYGNDTGIYISMSKAFRDDNIEKFKSICRGNFAWLNRNNIINDWCELGDGIGRVYYKGGKIFSILKYRCSNREGHYREYYKSGELRKDGYYIRNKKNGEYHGSYKKYGKDGELIKHCYYKDGWKQ